MAISERRRLTFTVIAVILLSAVTVFLLGGALLPSTTTTLATTPGTPALDSGEVDVLDDWFSPITIKVTVGATVTWTNLGHNEHSTTSATWIFDSGHLFPGDSFSYTFTKPGVYPYLFQQPHRMLSTVFVVE